MTEYFKALSDAEYERLKDSIALITVYIAGADGSIENDELVWADKVTKIRAYNLPEGLKGFYKEVGIEFQDKVDHFMNTLPKEVEQRNVVAEEELAKLNPILAKLNPKLGSRLYNSLLSFAKHVAKASGGLFGFFSIGPKEMKLLDLDMIEPIEYDEEEGE